MTPRALRTPRYAITPHGVRHRLAAGLGTLLLVACSSDPSATQPFGLSPAISSGFASTPSATTFAPNDQRWIDSAPVVGNGATQLSVRRMNSIPAALGVDKLGGFTTLTLSPGAENTAIALERFTSAGTGMWVREGACNGPLQQPRLLVDERGQSLFAVSFAGACDWGNSVFKSESDPPLVAQSFDQVNNPLPTQVFPSQDVMLFAHSDEGMGRGFALFRGPGTQGTKGLVSAPQGASVFLDFEAQVTLEDEEFTSSTGGAGADQLWARATFAEVEHGDPAPKDTARELALAAAAQFSGERIAHVAARAGGLIVAGTGALPSLAPEAGESDVSDRGWLAALNEDASVAWAAAWQPPLAPRSLATSPDGSIYAAFDAIGVTHADAGASEPQNGVPALVTGLSIARFSKAGKLDWQRDFPSGTVHLAQLAASDEAVSVWASHNGGVDVDGILVLSAQEAYADALIMTLHADGTLAYVHHFGTAGGLDEAYSPVAHPAGGFMGLLRIEAGDGARLLDPATYVLRIPD